MNGWLDLPPELLAIICDALKDLNGIRRFRSVCRSWRSFLPLPSRNRISPLFPHRISVSSPPFTGRQNHHRPIDLISKSIYLLRPHTDPSTVWLVSMEEANPGSLRLRHPITYDPLHISPPDLSSGWSVTEIANSHSFCFADGTRQVLRFDDWWGEPIPNDLLNTKQASTGKLVLVSSNPRPNRVSDFTAVVLYSRCTRVCAFRLSNDEHELVDDVTMTDDTGDAIRYFHDIVNFNGRVWAVDSKGRVFIVDLQTLRLTRMDDSGCLLPENVLHGRKRLVEANGELYMVSKFCEYGGVNAPNFFVLHKLVMHDALRRLYRWEKIDSVGDKVLFITVDCSYVVSAEHLPYPWRGNCVVFDREGVWPLSWCLRCPLEKEIQVLYLSEHRDIVGPFPLCRGYSHLFSPFSMGIRKWPCPNRRRTDEGTLSTSMELRRDKKCKAQAL